ncbi:agamous-like MADS-box protein AGL104 isoform X1 [Rosa chinensis]|uniref:agamous-like MADS-box protein AGL104 isoform X1 n=1 Tax=Rosa chinensis TaxID=74649 RepID=UPI001AD91CCA|nr:agamous-like MADS-box protein AGL104 isoform X1 [Rosa chinensis]XP_040365163.1 agamous-like MADS-box protein AGL104 isoform X1 [Rosa chinensis]
MGRVKLQMKRIENTANRQITFSKRKNGLIKKAYELSVLCDVDVALIMFSPSRRLSLFSGNKSIEDILARYINYSRHERGSLHNEEILRSILNKLKSEVNQTFQTISPVSADFDHVQEIQQEILYCKSQMEEVENQLRIFEGDLSKITTLPDIELLEQILEKTLNRLYMCKQVLGVCNSSSAIAVQPQIHLPPNADELVIAAGSSTTQPTYLDPQVEILNFLSANGFLPLSSDSAPQPVAVVAPMLPLDSQNTNLDDDMINLANGFEGENNNRRSIVAQVQQEHLEIEQGTDVNLLQWNQLYPTAKTTTSTSYVSAVHTSNMTCTYGCLFPLVPVQCIPSTSTS